MGNALRGCVFLNIKPSLLRRNGVSVSGTPGTPAPIGRFRAGGFLLPPLGLVPGGSRWGTAEDVTPRALLTPCRAAVSPLRDDRAQGGRRHVLVFSSTPVLLPPLQHIMSLPPSSWLPPQHELRPCFVIMPSEGRKSWPAARRLPDSGLSGCTRAELGRVVLLARPRIPGNKKTKTKKKKRVKTAEKWRLLHSYRGRLNAFVVTR